MRPADPAVLRAMRRLSEATGYLELGMTQHALAALDKIQEPGPLKAVAQLLCAEAARREHRFGDAVNSLEAAARLLPDPIDKSLWLAVSLWHRHAGNTDRAIESLAHARGARLPKPRPKPE